MFANHKNFIDYYLGQLTPIDLVSAKGKTSQLIDIVSQPHQATTISQQYTSFVFHFVETRSVDVTSVDRENNIIGLHQNVCQQ